MILTIAAVFALTAFSADKSIWKGDSREVGDQGWINAVKPGKLRTSELIEIFTSVVILNSDGTSIRAAVESGNPNGKAIIRSFRKNFEAGAIQPEKLRVVCVGTYWSKTTKKRFLIFRVKEFKEE